MINCGRHQSCESLFVSTILVLTELVSKFTGADDIYSSIGSPVIFETTSRDKSPELKVAGMQRPAAVAGTFYPRSAVALRTSVSALLSEYHPPVLQPPRALIVPHAGLVYSGKAAAAAYAHLNAWRSHYKLVIVIAPPHRKPVRGLAMSSATSFQTPLGLINQRASDLPAPWQALPHKFDDQAHADEHAIEVQLPFLHLVLDDFEFVPMLAAGIKPELLADMLEQYWEREDALIVISTDLSHFHNYRDAQTIDGESDAAIIAADPAVIDSNHACGATGLNGLLELARRKSASISRLAQYNSGDTGFGDRDRVVGYASYRVDETS